MDLLQLAEENYLVSFTIILVVGLLQGGILARGIRNRFPSLKRHARLASITLLILFSFNAIANVFKFGSPEKLSVSDLSIPSTAEEGYAFVINVLGLNAGFVTVIAMSISIIIILFLRYAKISRIARYFIFSISIIMLLITVISRVMPDYTPTEFQIYMYAVYQLGLTAGIFFVTRRKEPDLRELE